MMAHLIDGKEISLQIKEELKQKAIEYKERGIEVTLAVIQVGNDPASSVYVGNKKKACEFVGIRSLAYELPEETTQEELIALVKELNERADVNGILVQLPLPSHINEDFVIKTIAPEKDVDGFHSTECRSFINWPEGICFLYTRRNHRVIKTLKY